MSTLPAPGNSLTATNSLAAVRRKALALVAGLFSVAVLLGVFSPHRLLANAARPRPLADLRREQEPSATTPPPTATPIPVGGHIDAKGACYVRLPDLPAAPGVYGGFGAYNPQSGVLTYAGGAEKRSDSLTIARHDLYAIRLDGSQKAWKTISYPNSLGYLRDPDTGCREMASVSLGNDKALSVFGKGGCDRGRFDGGVNKEGGDLQELLIGGSADVKGVRWAPNSGAKTLIGDLEVNKGKLTRPFGVFDSQRDRVVFGQGTFDVDMDAETADTVYAARRTGGQWQLTELRPEGTVPSRRFGSCAAYVHDEDLGLDGVIVIGGQQGGLTDALTYDEVWWLDFSSRPDGVWKDISARFSNRAAFGPRREGACAYDPSSRNVYSWMGRSSKDIPGGAKHSSGVWRVRLVDLGGDGALTWERLAKDDQKGLRGRNLVPSVWDPEYKRLFVLGGRNDLEELADVWVIYPDVIGEACDALDPYAPFRIGPTLTPPPTRTPSPTATAPPASPTPADTATTPPTTTVTPSLTPASSATPMATASRTATPRPAGLLLPWLSATLLRN